MPGELYGDIKIDSAGLDKIKLWKEIIETVAGVKFTTFEPVQYANQYTHGTNYKSKIKVGEGIYIHAVVNESSDYTHVECTSVELGKKLSDPLLG